MNHERTIEVAATVKMRKGDETITAEAIFATVRAGDRIALVLDKAPPERSIDIVLLHPEEQALRLIAESQCVALYRYDGEPIDVSEYVALAATRRGFRLQ